MEAFVPCVRKHSRNVVIFQKYKMYLSQQTNHNLSILYYLLYKSFIYHLEHKNNLPRFVFVEPERRNKKGGFSTRLFKRTTKRTHRIKGTINIRIE